MEMLLEEFQVPAKHPSTATQMRWRNAVSMVRNRSRRFRHVADLESRTTVDRLQEHMRISNITIRSAMRFIDASSSVKTSGESDELVSYIELLRRLTPECQSAGFRIGPEDLQSILNQPSTLQKYGGVEGLARLLCVSLDKGITTIEAPCIDVRRECYGSNKYNVQPTRSLWIFIWEAQHDWTLIVLTVCSLISIVLGVATKGWPDGVFEGVGILLSILMVVSVTAVSDYKQYLLYRDLMAEKDKIRTLVTRDGVKIRISIYELVVGDVVHLLAGDNVPADGIFISGAYLTVDQSSLTGESNPIVVHDKQRFLLSGSRVQDGSGKMLVTSVGMKTQWGKLMASPSKWDEDETPLQVKLNGVATVVGKIGLVFSVLVLLILTEKFLVGKIQHNEFQEWSSGDALKLLNYLALALSIYMVAVPEGLPLAVTLSLAFAMRKLMQEKALVRHPSACESMGFVTCICTDKTGTLTTNHMTVDTIWMCDKVITSINNTNDWKLAIPDRILPLLLQSILMNTSSLQAKDENDKDFITGTPTEAALLEFGLLMAANIVVKHWEANVVTAVPFNYYTKRMSTVIDVPEGGCRVLCKGAANNILNMCIKFVDSNGESIYLSEDKRKNIRGIIDKLSAAALRTMCFAYQDLDTDPHEFTRDMLPYQGYTLIAVVGLSNPLRPGVKDAIQDCLAAGIDIKMITGDNLKTAIAVARECAILTEDGLAMEGKDLWNTHPSEWPQLVSRLQVMACSTPADKNKLVNLLMVEDVVAVTGDGTNDAPALKTADVGLAMNIAGTQVAKESGDVVIMDDNFNTVVNLVKWGRSVYLNIQNFLQFQMTVNVVALMLNFISACILGSTPLAPVQLIWINMIMDTLGALALATEPPRRIIMRRPPIRKQSFILTPIMWRNIIGQSIYQLVVLLVLRFKGISLLGLQGSDADSVLDTVIFNSFVFCQVFNEINSRESERLNVFSDISRSWLFLLVVGVIMGFQVILVQCLGFLANTVPLTWQLWVFSMLIGCASLIVAVILKWVKPANHVKTVTHDGYDFLPDSPEHV